MLNTQLVEVFRGKALGNGALTRFTSELPMGEAWTRMCLRFTIVLANTTGTGVIAGAELAYVKGITLRTDRGELICNSAPGRLLYAVSAFRSGTPPIKTSASASAGTFYVHLEIPFSDMRLASGREEHRTILDTARYRGMELSIALGTVADWLGSVGDAVLSTTVDCYIERFKGALPAGLAPDLYAYYGVMPPAAPASQAYIDLEKTDGLNYKRLILFSSTGATAGVPCSGVDSDAQIMDFDIEHNDGFEDRAVLWDEAQRAAQTEYGMAAIPAGRVIRSFVDRSKELSTMLQSGGRSLLKVSWRNNSTSGTPQVTLGFEATKPLA